MKSGSESDCDAALEGPNVCRSRRRITFPAQVSFQCAVQQQDNVELVKHLSQHGSRLDVNATNHSGVSLLQQAVLNRNLDTVKILLCATADVTTRDINGNTALHSAASCGFRQAASLLVIFGADMFALNLEGDMPVDLAKDNATVDMLTLEMRQQLQNQIFLDQYGFIFRAIVLWESFMEWSKAFVAQAATFMWNNAKAQYHRLLEQRLAREAAGNVRCIKHAMQESGAKNGTESGPECAKEAQGKGEMDESRDVQAGDVHRTAQPGSCNLSESVESIS
ncbi:uncharacterized protein [Diadema setosum]|uniref:uncharacterized protein n=1 Tax=Diadema setosum TaxID=31175 RepID=UPI003B3A5F04